jgi:hypothetical protein
MDIKESLGTKVGPLPMAAWGAIAIVGVIIYSSYKKNGTTNTSTPNGTSTADTTTVGYEDANGNPIVPVWSTLPESAPGSPVSQPVTPVTDTPTSVPPPPAATPTPTPRITPKAGKGHAKQRVVSGATMAKRNKTVAVPRVTSGKNPNVAKPHVATASKPATKPKVTTTVKAAAQKAPIVTRGNAAQVKNNENRLNAQNAAQKPARVVSGATMAKRGKAPVRAR